MLSSRQPRAVQRAAQLLGLPGVPLEALAADVAVEVDVLDERLERGVAALVADVAEDQQAHLDVVEVGAEGVQHVHLGAAHRVLVEGVVADGHDHGEERDARLWGVRARALGVVRVRRGQGERRPPEVDAALDVGDPGRDA